MSNPVPMWRAASIVAAFLSMLFTGPVEDRAETAPVFGVMEALPFVIAAGFAIGFLPLAIQAFNPMNQHWSHPSWSSDPRSDFLQMAHFGSHLVMAMGFGMFLRAVVMDGWLWTPTMAIAAGFGMLLGVRSVMIVFKEKMDPHAD